MKQERVNNFLFAYKDIKTFYRDNNPFGLSENEIHALAAAGAFYRIQTMKVDRIQLEGIDPTYEKELDTKLGELIDKQKNSEAFKEGKKKIDGLMEDNLQVNS